MKETADIRSLLYFVPCFSRFPLSLPFRCVVPCFSRCSLCFVSIRLTFLLWVGWSSTGGLCVSLCLSIDVLLLSLLPV